MLEFVFNLAKDPCKWKKSDIYRPSLLIQLSQGNSQAEKCKMVKPKLDYKLQV